MPSFDLRDKPWIPVTTLHGDRDRLSLRETLHRAHDLADIAVTAPPAAAGLLRLLYVVTARITRLDRPAGAEEWELSRSKTIEAGQLEPAAIDSYLDKHPNGWDLFNEQQPWMQDSRLVDQAEEKSTNRFDPTRPGDNSPVWGTHTHVGHAPPIPAEDAALLLLYHHLHGSGGAGGTRTIGSHSDQYMSAGPLRGALTHYPLGLNLLHTLLAGIPSPATAPTLEGTDVAPWETTQLPDPLAPPPPVTWPAGLLLGRSRHALLLHPDSTGQSVTSCRLTWAFKHAHPDIVDPYVILQRASTGAWYNRPASADRAVWRNIDALLASTPDHRRPLILTDTLTLPAHIRNTLRVRVHGVDQDRKATNRQWMTATTPPIIPLLEEFDPDAAHGAETLHNAAADIAGVLRSGLRQAYSNLALSGSKPRGDGPWMARAEALFWSWAETLFWTKLNDRDFTEPHRAFGRLARDVVNDITDAAQHHLPVAREIAGVHRYLANYAAKKNPRKDPTRA